MVKVDWQGFWSGHLTVLYSYEPAYQTISLPEKMVEKVKGAIEVYLIGISSFSYLWLNFHYKSKTLSTVIVKN